MLCGSAFKNKGVQPLLDAVVDYLPSPLDRPAIKGIDVKTEAETERKSSDSDPLALLGFKLMDDQYGILTFCRIYSGKLEKGVSLLNSVRGKTERVGRMVLMHADSREEISEAYAGDIVALVGLKDTRTGDTLCDPNHPVILEKMEFPDPVIEMAVEPKSKADQEKMGVALAKLAAEDPSFRVNTDSESGQTIIKGMGELHLDIKVDILKRTHKVEVNVGAPQVAYRETIRRSTDIDYTHKKQTGGTGQFAPREVPHRTQRVRQGLRVRVEDHRRFGPEGILPRRREGPQLGPHLGSGGGLPGRGRQGPARRRRLSRGRLLGDRLRNRLSRGVP